jgi:hypothetical protein
MIEVRQRPFDGRLIDMETLNLGLSTEEDVINNFGVRESMEVQSKAGITKVDTLSNEEEKSSLNNEKGLKRKLDLVDIPETSMGGSGSSGTLDDSYSGKWPEGTSKRAWNRPKSSVNGLYKIPIARPIYSMKGHSAFLTFAVRRNIDETK